MATIEDGIPLPGTRKRREPNNPWGKLEVGQSFFVINRSTAETGCYVQSAKLDRKFEFHPWKEVRDGQEVNGFRVWRVE